MRRLLSLALGGWLMLGLPATAGVINLNRDEVPSPGHFSLVTQGLFAPYQLIVLNGQTFGQNPPEKAYYRLGVASQLEAGLLPDVGMSFTLPFAFSRRVDGSEQTGGLADLNLGLFWRLAQTPRATWKAKVHANIGAGNLVGRISEGVPSVGLENSLRMELMPRFLYGHLNLNYLYQLRSTGLSTTTDLPVVLWRGQRVQLNGALEAALMPGLTGLVEVLTQYDIPSESQRQIVPKTGDYWVAVAPGLSVAFTPTAAGQLSVVMPLLRGGYQDSFYLSVVTGLTLGF
ncbi:MAG TPA: hypothetical protein V6D05_05955 [Stenomitos sp.]